jgi:hypothetical protein
MSRKDEIKEELSYLKVWLGIVVVTAISLISWLINNYDNESMLYKVIFGIIAIFSLSLTIIKIDKVIKRKIRELRDL